MVTTETETKSILRKHRIQKFGMKNTHVTV
jgi:hypothetical protein